MNPVIYSSRNVCVAISFLAWLWLAACEGKFYTVEKYNPPRVPVQVTVLKEEVSPEWLYTGKNGAENWASIAREYAPCADGKRQSPINFTRAEFTPGHRIHFSYKASYETILNNGNTLELVYDKGSQLAFDGKMYELIQFHFHTPAEHLIYGKQYPMEMHLVHRSADTTYLVIGVLFEEGTENQLLSKLVHYLPVENKEIQVDQFIQAATLFPEQKHFYHYQGSFTTPPCTEGVRWLVLQQIQQASVQQIKAISNIEGNNARHSQALHHRQVEQF